MNRIFALAIFMMAACCSALAADNAEVRWRLRLVGDPVAPLNKDWFFFATQDECIKAVQSGYGDLPSVKPLGDKAWFDCTMMIRALPTAPVVSVPPVVPPVVSMPAAGLSPACSSVPSLYSTGFQLNADRAVDPIAAMAKPPRGAAFKEPAYGTCVVRAADHVADSTGNFARNSYSRRQSFNADSSMYLIEAASGGDWYVYDAKTYKKIKKLESNGLGGGDNSEPQWHATNPDLLYFIPVYGFEMKLNEFTISNGSVRTVGDFAARLKSKWPNANNAWTKGEGSPSKDGRYWCFMVDDANWGGVGVFTWDRDTDTILGMRSVTVRPDHVSMSPSGNYCVTSGGDGTIAWSKDFSQQRVLLPKSEHSDLAIDANGDDVYVSIDYDNFDGGPDNGDVFMLNLRTGVRTNLFPTYINRSYTGMHFSGKSFNRPGWVVMSTYADGVADGPYARQWLHKKVMAVELKAGGRVLNLAFNRDIYRTDRKDENGKEVSYYFAEPHASANRDFTRVLFNTNWNVDSPTDIDAYVIELPPGLVK